MKHATRALLAKHSTLRTNCHIFILRLPKILHPKYVFNLIKHCKKIILTFFIHRLKIILSTLYKDGRFLLFFFGTVLCNTTEEIEFNCW